MNRVAEIARSGLDSIPRHPFRSATTVAALVFILVPYLAGMAISLGIEEQVRQSLDLGADLYVAGKQFGRPASIDLGLVERIKKVDGVVRALPRIVGTVHIGKESAAAVLVGSAALDGMAGSLQLVEGRLPSAASHNEIAIGTELARDLGLKVGALVPPFYNSRQGEFTSKVVGIFRPEAPIWQANLVLTSFAAAAVILDQPGRATDVLVYCRAGYADRVRKSLLESFDEWQPKTGPAEKVRVVRRLGLEKTLPAGTWRRQGIFNLHYLLAFAIGIPLIEMMLGHGLNIRKREVGLLKTLGWQTDEVILRSFAENFLLGLMASALSLILAFIWVRVLNGYWLAGLFLPGISAAPSFRLPSRFTPIPFALAFLLSMILVLTGSLYSTWKTATANPIEAIRS